MSLFASLTPLIRIPVLAAGPLSVGPVADTVQLVSVIQNAATDLVTSDVPLRAPLLVPQVNSSHAGHHDNNLWFRSAALMVAPEAATEYSTFEIFVIGVVSFWTFIAVASILGSIGITYGQRYLIKQKARQAANRALSAEARLDKILERVREGTIEGTAIREPITIEDEKLALQAGLDVLRLWQKKLPDLPKAEAAEAWDMALIAEQGVEILPPTFTLMITPGSMNSSHPNETILADTSQGDKMPDLETLLQKTASLSDPTSSR